MKWLKWFGIIFGILFFLFILLLIYLHPFAIKQIDYDNPPKFIQADYIDLSKIYIISKYRSSVGHSTDDSVEKCLSLRHIYGDPHGSEEFTDSEKKWSLIHNRPDPQNAIDIYAPVDGLITDTSSSSHEKDKQGIAGTIVIKPDNAPGFDVRIDSVFINPNIRSLMRIKAGEKIGVICTRCPGEITVEYNYIFGRRAVSYFSVLSDQVFTDYQKRGMKSRDEAIITKAYRDAHPFTCADPKNETSEILDNPEMHDFKFSNVALSGYYYPEEIK
jgi:hypothetical protein